MIPIPEEIWNQTKVIQDKRLKLRALSNRILPDWTDAHESVCGQDDHGKCKVPPEVFMELSMMLRELDKLNIDIIELQRPYAEQDEGWRTKTQEYLNEYAAWKDMSGL